MQCGLKHPVQIGNRRKGSLGDIQPIPHHVCLAPMSGHSCAANEYTPTQLSGAIQYPGISRRPLFDDIVDVCPPKIEGAFTFVEKRMALIDRSYA